MPYARRKKEFNLVRLNRMNEEYDHRTLIHDRLYENENAGFPHFMKNNPVLMSVLSIVFIPYMFGMLLTLILFYFYVGVSVADFFHVYQGFSQLVFWMLGTYLIITFTDIWLLAQKFFIR